MRDVGSQCHVTRRAKRLPAPNPGKTQTIMKQLACAQLLVCLNMRAATSSEEQA